MFCCLIYRRLLFNAAVDDTREMRIKSPISEKLGDQSKMFLIMTCHCKLKNKYVI